MNALLAVAEENQICVEFADIPLNGSVSVQYGDGMYIGLDYRLETVADRRVHMAHELGHCVSGGFYSPYAIYDIREKHEYRANKWAIRRLMPQDEVNKAVAQGYDTAFLLAERFDVTPDFAQRAINLYKGV